MVYDKQIMLRVDGLCLGTTLKNIMLHIPYIHSSE